MAENIKVIADKIEIDDIAEAVREKTGKTEKMSLGAIARNIRGMSEAGSASIDTCTVLFSPGYYNYRLTTINNNVAAVIDGQIAGKYVGDSVDNVLCNTLAIITAIEDITSITVDGSSDNIIYNDSKDTKVVLIPNKNNQNVEINVETI